MVAPTESEALTAAFERRLQAAVEATVICVGWCHALRQELIKLGYDERVRAKHQLGLSVPPLVPVLLPSIRWVYMFPAEMDERGINVQVLNICRNHPHISMSEVAGAMRRAYPWLKGKDRLDMERGRNGQVQVLEQQKANA